MTKVRNRFKEVMESIPIEGLGATAEIWQRQFQGALQDIIVESNDDDLKGDYRHYARTFDYQWGRFNTRIEAFRQKGLDSKDDNNGLKLPMNSICEEANDGGTDLVRCVVSFVHGRCTKMQGPIVRRTGGRIRFFDAFSVSAKPGTGVLDADRKSAFGIMLLTTHRCVGSVVRPKLISQLRRGWPMFWPLRNSWCAKYYCPRMRVNRRWALAQNGGHQGNRKQEDWSEQKFRLRWKGRWNEVCNCEYAPVLAPKLYFWPPRSDLGGSNWFLDVQTWKNTLGHLTSNFSRFVIAFERCLLDIEFKINQHKWKNFDVNINNAKNQTTWKNYCVFNLFGRFGLAHFHQQTLCLLWNNMLNSNPVWGMLLDRFGTLKFSQNEALDPPEHSQKTSKTSSNPPEITFCHLRWSKDHPRTPPNPSKMCPLPPKMSPRASQDLPKTPPKLPPTFVYGFWGSSSIKN